MSLLKLLVISAFIGLTVEIYFPPCEGGGLINETSCTNTAMPHGKFCCYLEYSETLMTASMCTSLEFSDTKNYAYHKEEIEKQLQDEDPNNTIIKFVCPNETKYIPNNCGTAGVTVPQSKETCFNAKIPEQHCCYLTYKAKITKENETEETSHACRRFAKIITGTDKESNEDIEPFQTEEVSITPESLECSHLFIKLTVLSVFVIMISLI